MNSRITLKYQHIWLFAILMFVGVTGCKPPQCIPYQKQQLELSFGDGGGFRGQEWSHLILSSGCVFRKQREEDSWRFEGTLKRKVAKSLIKTASGLSEIKGGTHHPGPVYMYIELRQDGKPHRVTWGDPANPPSGELEAFYQRLRKEIDGMEKVDDARKPVE